MPQEGKSQLLLHGSVKKQQRDKNDWTHSHALQSHRCVYLTTFMLWDLNKHSMGREGSTALPAQCLLEIYTDCSLDCSPIGTMLTTFPVEEKVNQQTKGKMFSMFKLVFLIGCMREVIIHRNFWIKHRIQQVAQMKLKRAKRARQGEVVLLLTTVIEYKVKNSRTKH